MPRQSYDLLAFSTQQEHPFQHDPSRPFRPRALCSKSHSSLSLRHSSTRTLAAAAAGFRDVQTRLGGSGWGKSICVLMIVSRWYREYKANAKRRICVDPSVLDKLRSVSSSSICSLNSRQRNREGLEDNPLMA